jgi:hypothetical protein
MSLPPRLKPQPYPLDFTDLSKGDSITPERMEKIFGVPRTHPEYPWKVMSLAKQIEDECEALGRLFTVCQRDGSLCILDDDDAHSYNRNEHERAVRMMARSLRRQGWVDSSKLKAVSTEDHAHQLDIQARQVAALYSERRQLRLPRPEIRQLQQELDKTFQTEQSHLTRKYGKDTD